MQLFGGFIRLVGMDPITDILRRCAESSDEELFLRLESGTSTERAHLVETLPIIGELHERRAALPKGFPSLFVYCTQRLGYCERTAYRRIAAAKSCRAFPVILERLRSGKLHLTAVVLLRDHLTIDNHESLLARAEDASLDQLKRMAAALNPAEASPPERTRVIAVVDKARLFIGLESPPGQSELPQSPSAAVKYRTEHQFTLGDAGEAKLKRARELLAHKFPMGDIESIFEAALDSLLEPSTRLAGRRGRTRILAQLKSRRGASRSGSAVRCANATRTAAPSCRAKASGAGNGGSCSSIISFPGRWAAAPTTRATSASCAEPTIAGRGVTRSSRGVDPPSTDPLSRNRHNLVA